ncbi:MAG: hypothetical protein Q8L74_13605 [Nitrospirota bacterium]|nr:hypothetical protein [Nitrospirota bacterium]
MEHITWTIGIGALTGLIVSGIVLIIGQFTVKVVLHGTRIWSTTT